MSKVSESDENFNVDSFFFHRWFHQGEKKSRYLLALKTPLYIKIGLSVYSIGKGTADAGV